jgi:DNA-binding MarR family transcriptional regulator
MNVAVKIKAKTAAPTPGKQRLRLWIRILRASRAIESEVRERLRLNFGVTLPQFDVMAALERKPNGMTMTELSRFLMVSNGNVTGIIDRLVTEKLVVRQAPANDRRAIIVRLTARGLKDFTAMAKAHQGWIDNLLSEFDAAEAETLIEHLDGLSSRIRNGGARS